MLVHIYFVGMLFPLWAIGLFFHYSREEKKWGLIVDIFTLTVVLLLVGYSIGLFSLNFNNLQGSGFGYFSWNLNGFINSINFSGFIKGLPLGSVYQSEGFSYLGLGNLFILPYALYLFLRKDHSRRRWFFFLPFGVVAILLSLYALSQKAYFSAQPLWDIQLPGFILSLFSIFRVSGRFIWPVFYFLVLFGLISLLRNSRYPVLVLSLALMLQYFDVQPLVQAIKFHGFKQYQSPLQAEFWQQAAKTNQHVMLMPATSDAINIYEPFALYALQNKLTLNWGYFARADYAAIENYANQTWEHLKVGQADPRTLYIFWDPAWVALAKEYLPAFMLLCQVNGYEIILSPENKLT